MAELGFKDAGAKTFVSRRCPFDVVLAPAPLTVGDDVVRNIDTLKTREGAINLLSPTDCVRERLAMYYQWGDQEAFREAIDVARRHPVDQALIKRWSDYEWYADRYAEFLGALKEASEARG